MSSKENKKIAEEVIAAIGGKENIVSLAHCATRLRIVVKDRKKVNEKALDKIDKAKDTSLRLVNIRLFLVLA